MLLDLVRQEEAAVEVANIADQLRSTRVAQVVRPRETFEKERAQELGIEAINTARLALFEPALQILVVAAVEEALALQEVDEHQPVQQHRGIPAPLALVGNALDRAEQGLVQLFERVEELARDWLDVERLAQSLCDIDQRNIAVGVQLADVDKHRAELADQQVARLALHEGMPAWKRLAALALDPVPQAARALGIQKDQEVFEMKLCNIVRNRAAQRLVGDRTVIDRHLKNNDAGEIGDLAASYRDVFYIPLNRLGISGVAPAKFFDKQRAQIERLQGRADARDINGHVIISCVSAGGDSLSGEQTSPWNK
ncbi:MAG: hypothetical protein IPP13_15970 [Kouleothrix sp.]|nr:hypothetical protein [Kouleothrix sp.]